MNVYITNKLENNYLINVPTQTNWIGGQEALINIHQKNDNQYNYYVRLIANEDGIFNVEARTSNAVISINDRSMRFETVNENQENCYLYASKDNTSMTIEAKSIKGDLSIKIVNENEDSKSINFNVLNGENQKRNISFEERQKISQSSGNWKICMKSTSGEEVYYNLQVYETNKLNLIKEYQRLLLGKLFLIYRINK